MSNLIQLNRMLKSEQKRQNRELYKICLSSSLRSGSPTSHQEIDSLTDIAE